MFKYVRTYKLSEKKALMKKILELEDVPKINKSCEKCMYLNKGKDFI